MSEIKVINMICPKCGKFQVTAEFCNDCGIVIAKVRQEEIAVLHTANMSSQINDSFTRFTHVSTPVEGPKQKWVMPLVVVGTVLLCVAMTMLGSKLNGGFANYEIMSYLDWLIIPSIGMTGIGCIILALDWKFNNS